MTIKGIPCTWMRGGTSKGGFFLATDLPNDEALRNKTLLSIMGSPDDRQIDGLGGATSLTSKVAIVSASMREGVDVEYLFLQVSVDSTLVSDGQNCGNMLAGVAPFAIEQGLVTAGVDETNVTIFQRNSEQIAIANVKTPNGVVQYAGNASIDGVPGTSAPVLLEFQDTAGSSCGSLLPSGNPQDTINGINVTMIDNGMPSVVLHASAMGMSGSEDPDSLTNDADLKSRLESLRITCGHLMNLGDVSDKTVPKMVMISAPVNGGTIHTRSFIPHKCHTAIGVLGAVSVATVCVLEGSVAETLAQTTGGDQQTLVVEHPSGELSVVAKLGAGLVVSAAVLRTTRKLMQGQVFPNH